MRNGLEGRMPVAARGAIASAALIAAVYISGCGGEKTGGKTGTPATPSSFPAQDCTGAVKPTRETIESGTYTPLSRPLFLYVNRKSLARPEVAAFLRYYLNEGQSQVPAAGYVRLAEPVLQESRATLAAAAGVEQPVPKQEATINIDGSSTVAPISQAVAETFMEQHPMVRIPVGISGTGGGLKKFVVGEIDICDASRPIKQPEIEQCTANQIEFIELRVAIDGLSVIVNPKNDWCDCLSIEQLKRIWEPNSQIQKWSDLDPAWPAEKIKLYGPDTDSGTFEYFTEVVCGKAKASRSDYSQSGDDNVLVQGVAGDRYALGYFGYAYFEQNQDRLKVLAIKPAQKTEK